MHDFSYLMKTNLRLLDDCQDFLRLTQKCLGKQSFVDVCLQKTPQKNKLTIIET